jgi:hypothetical protein
MKAIIFFAFGLLLTVELKSRSAKILLMMFELTFLLGLYSSFAQNTASGNFQPRYYASIQTIDDKMVKGLLMQMENLSMILYPGKWKELSKEAVHDSIVIAYSQIQQIKLKKKSKLLKGLLIGGGIGLAPIVFGQGGAFAAILSFPLGIITGAIVGSTSSKKFY